LTEFAFGREPRGWHFPVRNRLIAALAHGTLVVQAARRSGSLITAHHAMELGRDVFAVPGRIFDPLSQGCNSLIADGALVARTAEDILDGLCLAKVEKLGIELSTPSPCKPPPKGFAGTLLDHLPEGEALSAEDLANACGKAIDRVLAALLELELGGWLRREPGPVYVR
jgi:DNA processing protein